MKITGKVTNDDSFEFTLEEHGSTHFVTLDRSMLSDKDRTLLEIVVHELDHACRSLTKATAS